MLEEKFILENWEQDLEEGLYFVHLANGDSIGYNYESETFSLNNYWNEQPFEVIENLVNRYGVDL